MDDNLEKPKKDEFDKKEASITLSIFASVITSFIIFGLMMHLIVNPIVERTEAKVNTININYSKINDIELLTTNLFIDYKEFKEDLSKNLGDWNCKEYKRYFDSDCQNSILVNNTMCIAVVGVGYPYIDKRISVPIVNITYLPEICEEWEYVKRS